MSERRAGRSDLLVIGCGIAGLSAALEARRAGLDCTVLSRTDPTQTTTWYAQAGIAAALTADDSVELHRDDTIAAGAGLCDHDAVRAVVGDGPDRVRELIALGVPFDVDPGADDGALGRAREGAHSVARVLHAGGDASGRKIETALFAAAVADGIAIRVGDQLVDLLVEGGRCRGVRVVDAGDERELRADHVLVATGGAGQVFEVTTNGRSATGAGVAAALRAGVAVADLEFVQFHPTAIDAPELRPRPLVSEALRGEGAVLRDDAGEAFMAAAHPGGDLAPRDVVSRAIAARMAARGDDRVWLDATGIEDVADRFPTVTRACQAAGTDPSSAWIPVAPAAHYLCGGVVTDLSGATSLPGLWAAGEVACTGAHGANRLASNSLLEGRVFGVRAARAIAAGVTGPSSTGAMRGVLREVGSPSTATPPSGSAQRPRAPEGEVDVAALRRRLQEAMTTGAGVLRDEGGLARTAQELAACREDVAGGEAPDDLDLRDLLDVATALVRAADARLETRGAHTRTDRPDRGAAWHGRLVHRRNELRLVPIPPEAGSA